MLFAQRLDRAADAFDLPRLIADLADMFRQRASSKGLAFEAAAAEDLAPCVVADQGKTRQVLINLLGNAVKFTERGGVQLRVSTSVRPDGRSWLAAEVEDSGPGIADREMAQLFQPFGQAAGNSQIEGTGLGLAISREYARLMGGDLTARSQAGEGTVFRFEMPVTAGSESEAGPNLSRVSVKRVEPGNDSRVLVVDDDLNNREWISNLLSSVGFFIRGAADGEEALRVVAEWRPHFIFMDLRMPVMNGVEAMRAIRAGAGPQPAIIAWSASALDEDRRAAMDAGADAFISKPCRAQELLEEIARRLGIRYEYNEPIREPEAGFADIPAARASRLRALPAAWIQELHQATRKGEKARMNLAIGKIEQRDEALAEALRDLADRYEYDALSALCATTDQ